MLSQEIFPKLCPQYPLSAIIYCPLCNQVCVWGGGGGGHMHVEEFVNF